MALYNYTYFLPSFSLHGVRVEYNTQRQSVNSSPTQSLVLLSTIPVVDSQPRFKNIKYKIPETRLSGLTLGMIHACNPSYLGGREKRMVVKASRGEKS
jgi:hypothetical protein